MNIFNKYIAPLKNFLFLWFGQSLSQMGSTMTGFALAIWAFEETGSALVLSVSGLLVMVPGMVVGVLAGPLVDRTNKKMVMLLADMGTGLCTLTLFLLLNNDALVVWHIFVFNIVKSALNRFQSLASTVTVSAVVPKEYYVKTGGLQSLSDGVMQILAPVFAAILLGVAGLPGVLIFDIVSLVFACVTLAAFVKIPVAVKKGTTRFNVKQYFTDLKQGYETIKISTLPRKLLLFMIFVNLLAGIASYGLLTPMILARTGNDSQALLFVNGAVGLGGVAGALLVLIIPTGKKKLKTIFVCLALSFLLGDVLMSIGSSLPIWVAAGFLSSVFLPLFRANEGYYWRTIIPLELQGRVFSLKWLLQSGIAPVGMLIGGLLADYTFEPLMVNRGNGAGMAFMFLIAGVLGTIYSLCGLFSRSMKKAELEAES